MNKNKELTENLYNVCKKWTENFECPLGELEKPCRKCPAIFFVGIYN